MTLLCMWCTLGTQGTSSHGGYGHSRRIICVYIYIYICSAGCLKALRASFSKVEKWKYLKRGGWGDRYSRVGLGLEERDEKRRKSWTWKGGILGVGTKCTEMVTGVYGPTYRKVCIKYKRKNIRPDFHVSSASKREPVPPSIGVEKRLQRVSGKGKAGGK